MKRVFEWSQSGDEVAEAFWALTSYEQGLVFVRLAELQEAVKEADRVRGYVVGVPVNQWFECGREAEKAGGFDATYILKQMVEGAGYEKSKDS